MTPSRIITAAAVVVTDDGHGIALWMTNTGDLGAAIDGLRVRVADDEGETPAAAITELFATALKGNAVSQRQTVNPDQLGGFAG